MSHASGQSLMVNGRTGTAAPPCSPFPRRFGMNVSTRPGAFGCARTPIAAMFRRVALAGAVAVAACGVGVPAASAGQSEEIATGGGSVVFEHRGERVLAYDERRDG